MPLASRGPFTRFMIYFLLHLQNHSYSSVADTASPAQSGCAERPCGLSIRAGRRITILLIVNQQERPTQFTNQRTSAESVREVVTECQIDMWLVAWEEQAMIAL